MATAQTHTPTENLQELYPNIFIPSFHQAVELAAVCLEKTDGTAAHERFWENAGDPADRTKLQDDYRQAVADHIACWGATADTTVAQRLANIYAVRIETEQPPVSTEPPPGWTWPVCDDCLTAAHDHGVTGYVEQARFMEELGAELPDHICEMALDPEDRGRDHCSCGCRQHP